MDAPPSSGVTQSQGTSLPVAAAMFDDPMDVPPLMGVCQQQDFALVGVELVSTLLMKSATWQEGIQVSLGWKGGKCEHPSPRSSLGPSIQGLFDIKCFSSMGIVQKKKKIQIHSSDSVSKELLPPFFLLLSELHFAALHPHLKM